MASSFNQQILAEKLAKLNITQASIETLSHWCIFHMNKSKQVVETWDRQFRCSPRLPGALRNVIESGDETGRNAALRLINIWEERKVFGSHGQTLKDELIVKHSENGNRSGKHVPKQPAGSTLDKIISSYQVVHSGQVDEDVIINKSRSEISYFEKVLEGVDSNINSGQFNGPEFAEEMQGQHSILRNSINQLTTIELSRAGLVSQLREALHEEESKLEQVRSQLQVAQSQLEHANKVCQQLDHKRQVSFPEKEEDRQKSAAAEVAAKLTASTSSAQMLSYVLSSLASQGVIGNPTKDSSGQYPSEKRPKLDNDQIATIDQQLASNDPPPLPSLPPPQPPLPPMPAYSIPQYLQTAGPINAIQYGYSMSQQLPSGYLGVGTQMTGIAPFTTSTPNLYQGYQSSDGNLYTQQSSVPMAPISRQ